MIIYILNFLAAVFMAYFTFQVYPDVPSTALLSFLMFLGWYFGLWLLSYFYDGPGHFEKLPQIVGLALFYFKELFIASLRVAYDVLTPADHMKPGIIALPLDAKTDLEITLLANFITLTPGSLSLEISEDRSTLFIHETYIKDNDLERSKRIIKEGFERRILKITR
jgi:multicomponent Na+:H+ antiporter subunit E